MINVEEGRRNEAARCMGCGVPFCQSGIEFDGKRLGCPMHNLIPEWNEMLAGGNLAHALSRLLKVNCFPEFTGRVCPAFCQRACVLCDTGEPVQIRDNELYIIERSFAEGLMQPTAPESRSGKTAAVIGSGPAGLAAAYYLNRRGHTVTVFEREASPGGQLLSIPKKKLPPEIVHRRTSLMEAEGVIFRLGVEAQAETLAPEYDVVVNFTEKNKLVVLAIAEGRRKAAEAELELMGYTSIM